MCVQRFDDSQYPAIHITFRALLRSSSIREPRDPLLKVLKFNFSDQTEGHDAFLVRRQEAPKHFHVASTGFVEWMGREGHIQK
jgi:hypothetical protein